MPPEHERLRAALLELDVEPAELRADPDGRTWLPATLRTMVERDDACLAELRAFVRDELELYDEAQLCTDPFFTAQIVDSLPAPLPATGLTPRRRVALLAAFHVLGAVAAYVMLWFLAPDSLLGWLEQAHTWLEGGAEAGVLWAGAVALLIVGFASVLPRAHTPAA